MSKKGAKKNDDEGPDPNRINTALKTECDFLKAKIVSEQERRDKAESNQKAFRDRIVELDEEFTDERDKTKKIVDDMKRQYKTMQDDLNEKITNLEGQANEHESDIKAKDDNISLLEQQIKEECFQKDQQIEQLQKQIDEMSSDFAEMLKQTLSKMQERIELANVKWDDEDDGDGM